MCVACPLRIRTQLSLILYAERRDACYCNEYKGLVPIHKKFAESDSFFHGDPLKPVCQTSVWPLVHRVFLSLLTLREHRSSNPSPSRIA